MLETTKISPAAEKMIEDYFNLPVPNTPDVRCPYFNNARVGQRGQLKVLVGKGTPQEIIDEAKIISIQYKQDVFRSNDPTVIRKFLIDHNLGVDCSAFVVHVMKAHLAERGADLLKKIFITEKSNVLRWLISQLRPVEQISVNVLASEKNSDIVNNLEDIQAGDLIIMLKTGPKKERNHILLVTETKDNVISYAHARAWSSEGQYGHGVSAGTITLNNPKGLLEQTWEEKGQLNQDNETYWEAREAKLLQVKRLKF
mgnify:CR=1 FL=1